MAKWIIPANGKKYDIKAFFEKHDVVDWTKKVGYSNGDIVYIYCSAPEQRVRYKTIVENDALPPDQLMDDHEYWPDLKDFELSRTKEHVRLRLLQTFDSDKLGLKELKKHGLPIAPQGPFHLSELNSSR